MNVLVVNAGSSSLKYQLFDTSDYTVKAKGICERIGDEMGVLVWEESLGWGNGQDYVNGKFPPNELKDPEFCDL